MKIIGYSDVITNSSSEVFVIKGEDYEKLSDEIKEKFDLVTEDNLIKTLLESADWDLGEEHHAFKEACVHMLDIPDFLCYWNYYNMDAWEELEKIHSRKEIYEFFRPAFKDCVNKAYALAMDDCDWETCEKIQNELAKKKIEYDFDRV